MRNGIARSVLVELLVLAKVTRKRRLTEEEARQLLSPYTTHEPEIALVLKLSRARGAL